MSTAPAQGTLLQLSVDQIRPGANVRRDVSASDVELLGESLKVRQWVPLLVTPELVLIDGWRRWLAAQHAGLRTLWALVTQSPPTDTELKIAQLTMFLHRAGLSDYEKFISCRELLESNPKWDQKTLASHLHIDQPSVCKWLSPSRCIAAVQDALEQGLIGLSCCYAISRAPSHEQADLLADKLAGESRDTIERRVRRRKPAGESTVRTNRIHCELPNGVSVAVSGSGLTIDSVVDSLNDALRAAKKARTEGLDARTWMAVMRSKSEKVS